MLVLIWVKIELVKGFEHFGTNGKMTIYEILAVLLARFL